MNPYEAPQSTDSVQPAKVPSPPTRTANYPLPQEVKYFQLATVVVYLLSFIVPGNFGPGDAGHRWGLGAGFYTFIMGAYFFWHPLAFAWWANVFLWLSWVNVYTRRSNRALIWSCFAGLFAAGWCCMFLLKDFVEPGYIPYLCWLAAMLLQIVTAWRMCRYELQLENDTAYLALISRGHEYP